MRQLLLTVAIHYEHDIVLARQRARQVAGLLGSDSHDQVRLATAVSEIARNAFQYAHRGKVEFFLTDTLPNKLEVQITDEGPGISNLKQILDGEYTSDTGMGMGILGARRLMDAFHIESAPGAGTKVVLTKEVPLKELASSRLGAAEIAGELVKQVPEDPFQELQSQNQELLTTLAELEKRQTELAQLNKELEDTNRGVVALYAELDEKADYLRRASELKSQFLSNMTHEFRTPLNSILSLSRMLLDRLDGDLTAEQERQVNFIQRASTDLSELVNDLLDLAKVEAGKVVVRPAEFEIKDLFGALRGMLRPLLAHNTSVALQIEEPQGIPALNTDESKVSQVLRNLISNALKYTEKGEVRVRAALEPDGQVAFTVSDTGIGVAPADQERIFEEFAQVEGPHQTGKRGTGLGLPLSRRLAELLGGTLSVQSAPGMGSTFTLCIPTVYRGGSEVAFAPEFTEIDPTRQPVLIVEDNRETLFAYQKFLRGTRFQAVPATTLKQARLAVERFRPVAIVLDILLNHENSWALLSDLKAQEATRHIPVFVVTMVENERKARMLGANDYRAKPIDREWLLSRLETSVRTKTPDQVLIIDDDEASRYVLKSLLSETRYGVLESANGYEGLELARRHQPAAVILDLMMPEHSGFNVLQTLKSDPQTTHLPVIIHSAKVLSPAEREKLSEHAVVVLTKQHTDRQASIEALRAALVKAETERRERPETLHA